MSWHDGTAHSGAWRRGLAIVGAVLLAILAALVAWRLATAPRSAAASPVPVDNAVDPVAPPEALVYVSGAVVQPGLYRLPSTARVADAIAAAGGFTADADAGRLPDLAARVHDGKQINVPFRRGSSGGSGATLANRVDVNTATVEELRAVPAMPLGLPEAIVDARQNFGDFATLADMRSLLGIDAATFNAVKPYLRAGTSTR